MEDSQELLFLFQEKEAYLEGHFQLSSGLHSSNYMQCARVLQYPSIAQRLGKSLAAGFSGVDLVLSPALGGIIIGHETARALDVPFLFCEREEKEFKLRRGFQILPDQRVLVIEDVLTTGLSTKETIGVAERERAKIAGVGCIVDRSINALPFDHPVYSLLKLPLAQYRPESCPLCQAGIPLTKPGSRPR